MRRVLSELHSLSLIHSNISKAKAQDVQVLSCWIVHRIGMFRLLRPELVSRLKLQATHRLR